MAKYCGHIGFSNSEETSPGVWTEKVTPRKYFGDVIKNSRRYGNTDQVNTSLTISNTISVLSDFYARNNVHNMRYIEYAGHKWSIASVDVDYPRLSITMGGLYNGESTPTT